MLRKFALLVAIVSAFAMILAPAKAQNTGASGQWCATINGWRHSYNIQQTERRLTGSASISNGSKRERHAISGGVNGSRIKLQIRNIAVSGTLESGKIAGTWSNPRWNKPWRASMSRC